MQSVIPPGDSKRIVIAGKGQGFLGLAVHYGVIGDETGTYPTMTTAWEPSPAERAAIAAGANIVVQLIGTPPINPMCLYVTEIPSVSR